VPVIVLSPSTGETEAVAAVAAGAVDFLLEDQVDSFTLARAVRFAMERRRAEESQRRLHDAQVRRAEYERLERGLVPRPVLRDQTLRCEMLYRAGGDLAVLGGDFIDLVERSDGSIRAVVGDVAGHGAEEAAVGVSLRQVWRSLVLAEIEDEKILPLLERVLELEHEEALFVTVADVTVRPDRSTVCYRLAGHWPPLLDEGDGWRPLENDHRGMPLGVNGPFHSIWADHETDLSPGSTLLLFTDGLVDAQSPSGRLALEGLLQLIESMQPGWLLRDLLSAVEEVNGGPIDDDVALVRLAWTT
jgi:serine phosphatase RsbU (regulator of sigma subunit)